MAHLSSGESSKPQSPQKAFLMGELAAARRPFTQKDEEMRQMEERLQRLESAHVRSFTQYGSHEEEEDWRLNQFEERHQHPHHAPKLSLPYVKIPSFSGEVDPKYI